SGRSRRSTDSTPARSSGSRYVRSAHPASVMIVAGFELTRTVRMPSARSPRSAWLPEQANSQAWPMTIGPEPMTATDRMSGRLGNGGPIGGGEPVDEGGQGLAGVVRAGAGLGMELERGDVAVAQGEPFDGAVVERCVGDDAGPERRREVAARLGPAHREAVVLGGHEHAAGAEVEHRMVRSAVAEAQLERLEPQGPAEQLVA